MTDIRPDSLTVPVGYVRVSVIGKAETRDIPEKWIRQIEGRLDSAGRCYSRLWLFRGDYIDVMEDLAYFMKRKEEAHN